MGGVYGWEEFREELMDGRSLWMRSLGEELVDGNIYRNVVGREEFINRDHFLCTMIKLTPYIVCKHSISESIQPQFYHNFCPSCMQHWNQYNHSLIAFVALVACSTGKHYICL